MTDYEITALVHYIENELHAKFYPNVDTIERITFVSNLTKKIRSTNVVMESFTLPDPEQIEREERMRDKVEIRYHIANSTSDLFELDEEEFKVLPVAHEGRRILHDKVCINSEPEPSPSGCRKVDILGQEYGYAVACLHNQPWYSHIKEYINLWLLGRKFIKASKLNDERHKLGCRECSAPTCWGCKIM